ncbi:unnamed protein product [Brassica oleracea]
MEGPGKLELRWESNITFWSSGIVCSGSRDSKRARDFILAQLKSLDNDASPTIAKSTRMRNEDSEEKSVASVKVAAKVSSSFESEDEKETLATSSDSSDDGKSDQGEKVEQRMAKGDMKIGVVSYSGRWPLGGRFAGGRCGGLGRCGRC